MFKIIVDVSDLQRVIGYRLKKEDNEVYIARGGVDLSGAVSFYLCNTFSIPCTHLRNAPALRHVSYLQQRDLDELFSTAGLVEFFGDLNVGNSLIGISQKDGFIIIEGRDHVSYEHGRTDILSTSIPVNLSQ